MSVVVAVVATSCRMVEERGASSSSLNGDGNDCHDHGLVETWQMSVAAAAVVALVVVSRRDLVATTKYYEDISSVYYVSLAE